MNDFKFISSHTCEQLEHNDYRICRRWLKGYERWFFEYTRLDGKVVHHEIAYCPYCGEKLTI